MTTLDTAIVITDNFEGARLLIEPGHRDADDRDALRVRVDKHGDTVATLYVPTFLVRDLVCRMLEAANGYPVAVTVRRNVRAGVSETRDADEVRP